MMNTFEDYWKEIVYLVSDNCESRMYTHDAKNWMKQAFEAGKNSVTNKGIATMDYKQLLIDTLNSDRNLCDQIMSTAIKNYDVTGFHYDTLKSFCKEGYVIDQVGGEDEGRDYYNVVKFTLLDDSEVTIKFEGWYASYHGSEFEEFYEVSGQPETITVWKKTNVGERYTASSY